MLGWRRGLDGAGVIEVDSGVGYGGGVWTPCVLGNA